MFNSKIETTYQLFKKKSTCLLKNLSLFFHGSSFGSRPSEKLVPMPNSYVNSNKKM